MSLLSNVLYEKRTTIIFKLTAACHTAVRVRLSEVHGVVPWYERSFKARRRTVSPGGALLIAADAAAEADSALLIRRRCRLRRVFSSGRVEFIAP